jgi:hypothetical protein
MFYGSAHGFLGTPRLLMKLLWDICRQIYNLCRHKIEYYKLNEIYFDDVVKILLEKHLLPVVYTTYSGLMLFVVLLPISLWKYAKRLRPIQRVLFLMGVAISAVILAAIALEIFNILYVVHVAANGGEDIDRASLVSIRLATASLK